MIAAPKDGRQWRVVAEEVNREPVLTSLGMHILTGHSEETFKQRGIPEAALRDGRRRAQEAMAHTGSEAMTDALEYLADDLGLDLTDIHQLPIYAAQR